MKEENGFNQQYRINLENWAATWRRRCFRGLSNLKASCRRYRERHRMREGDRNQHSTLHLFHRVPVVGIAALSVTVATACSPVYKSAREVESKPPMVSYQYSSDEGLIHANDKARDYCSQYAAMASMEGTITEKADGSKTVTFECVKTEATMPSKLSRPLPSPPRGYTYASDADLLQAISSADAYCAQSGQVASSRIVTNADGSKSLTYQCIQR